MKILYICDNLAPFILNEILELKKQGHDFFILSDDSSRVYKGTSERIFIKNGLDKQFYRFSKIKNRKQKYLLFFEKLLYDFLDHPICAAKACFYLMKNYPNPKHGVVDYLDIRPFFCSGIDAIHSPFSTPSIIDKVSLLANILNVPLALSFKAHDMYEGNNLFELQKKVKKIQAASQIIAISGYNAKHLKNQIGIDKDIEIIHDAINLELFTPTNLEKSRKSIIAVCRLHEQKGLIYLIHACNILNERKIDYVCTIIGEGSEKKAYQKLIDELQIPNINFIEFLSYEKIKEHLRNPTVFVLPCVIASDGKRDILANVLKEAMAMEIPVITSNICGIEELVDDGTSGILVPPKRPEAIADAIEKIMNHPDLGRKMGEEGRKKIEKEFNIKSEIGKLDLIFKKMVNHSSTRTLT